MLKDSFRLTQADQDQPIDTSDIAGETQNRRTATAFTIVIALLLTLGSFFIAERLQRDKERGDANIAASRLSTELTQRFASYKTLVQHISGLYALKRELSPGDLAQYLDRLDQRTVLPSLVRLQVAEALWSPGDRSKQEPQLVIRRVSELRPGAKAKVGEQFLQETDISDIFKQLLQDGERVVTLASPETVDEKTLLFVAPLYSVIDLPKTEMQRRKNFVGITIGEVDVAAVFNDTLRQGDPALSALKLLSAKREAALVDVARPQRRSNRSAFTFQYPLTAGAPGGNLSVELTLTKQSSSLLRASTIILGVGSFFTVLLGILIWLVATRREAAIAQLAEAAEQNKVRLVLLRELNHRVKNVMATVVSLASLSRRYATTVDEYYEDFSARVSALSSAHTVLIQSEWHGARIRDLIQAESEAYGHVNSDRFTLSGPELELRPSAALTLGLAFHELTTNAAKYGALSNDVGRISIKWTFVEIDGKDHIRVEWRESGGPVVKSPTGKTGFGSLLLEKLTARDLSGAVDIRYPETGVECDMLMMWSKVKASEQKYQT